MKVSKKQRQAEQILNHGLALIRIFNLNWGRGKDWVEPIGPATLCKRLRRIENQVTRWHEDLCNGVCEPTEAQWEARQKRYLDKLDGILHFRDQGIPVILNGDPRGYALKIEDRYVKDNRLEIYRDWGGYGIIAPEFTGE